VNCEMGSIIFTYQKSHAPGIPGGIVQSLDLFDFSVIHLSAFERNIKRNLKKLPKKDHPLNVTNEMSSLSKLLHDTYPIRHASIIHPTNTTKNTILLNKLNRTVAMMPFLGYTNGAGHSVLANRFHYLAACFWSIYAYIPHIIVTVCSKNDYKYAKFVYIYLLTHFLQI
jgi:hypothetical protein